MINRWQPQIWLEQPAKSIYSCFQNSSMNNESLLNESNQNMEYQKLGTGVHEILQGRFIVRVLLPLFSFSQCNQEINILSYQKGVKGWTGRLPETINMKYYLDTFNGMDGSCDEPAEIQNNLHQLGTLCHSVDSQRQDWYPSRQRSFSSSFLQTSHESNLPIS